MLVTVVEQGFPKDRPLFRRDCSLNSCEKVNFFSRLINVHEGLEPAGVTGGCVSLVSGRYEYYHYTQVRSRARSRLSLVTLSRYPSAVLCIAWIGPN